MAGEIRGKGEEERRRRTVVVAALYLAYASFYLCRANVDAALPLLSAAYGYDKESLGRLTSIAILGYAAGKVLLGPTGDFIGGRRLLGLAILGSVLSALGFGASTSLFALTFFAAQNRVLQAGGWIGVVHVASRELAPEERGSTMGVLSTSFEVGNVLSLLLCGALVGTGFGWRTLFLVNPALFAVLGGMALFALRRTAQREERGQRATTEVAAEEGGAPPSAVPESPGVRLRWLLGVRSFWVAISLSFLLTFVRTGFATWIPMFLADLAARTGGSMSGALVKSAIFPAAGFCGALVAGKVSDRFGPGRRAPAVAVPLALLFLAILGLAHGGVDDMRVALVAIGACGLLLLGPYSLVGGAIVLDVASSRAAGTAAGWIDAGGYLGASLGGVLLGTLAQRSGWAAAFDALAIAALSACGVATWWGLDASARIARTEVAS